MTPSLPNNSVDRHSKHQLYYDNVVLQGQFNTAIPVPNVKYWVDKWSRYFKHIEVHGPFDSSTVDELRSSGIQVFTFDGSADGDGFYSKGFFSPMRNLASGLRRHKSSPDIQGVLLCSDDLLFDMTYLAEQGMGSDGSKGDVVFQQDSPVHPFLFFTPNYTVKVKGEDVFKPIQNAAPNNWFWWKRNCLNSISNALAKDSKGKPYMDKDGTFHVSNSGLSDLVYIPTKYADAIVDMAEWLADSKVFLECAMPTMIGHLTEYHGAKVSAMNTCAKWDRSKRSAYKNWVPSQLCDDDRRTNTSYHAYHPMKLSAYPLEDWGEYFDAITTGRIYFLANTTA